MKKIEELGISPLPWHVGEKSEGWYWQKVTSGEGSEKKVVCDTNTNFPEAGERDRLLIAAAPDLYAALWFQCYGETGIGNCRNCLGMNAEHGNCKGCPMKGARDALLKAGGEEAKEAEREKA